jgi:hypothetical protein
MLSISRYREKYNLASQTFIISPDGPPNYQGLHSGPPNYQNLWKKNPFLTKYPHNTPITCHFQLKNQKRKSKNSKKKLIFFKKL